jgi:hypothetical protein
MIVNICLVPLQISLLIKPIKLIHQIYQIQQMQLIQIKIK